MSDALAIAARVLPVLRAHGRPVESILSPNVPILTMRVAGCRATLTGPFRPGGDGLPEAPTGARPGPILYRLTVSAKASWHWGLRLAVDWPDSSTPTVHEFTPGEWVDSLLAALPSPNT